jgi:hypothetical protein
VNAVASTLGTAAVEPVVAAVVPVVAAAELVVVALDELDVFDDPPQAVTVTAISAMAPTTTGDLSDRRMGLLQRMGVPSYRRVGP